MFAWDVNNPSLPESREMDAIPLCIMSALLAMGFVGSVWPQVLYSLQTKDPDEGEGEIPTPAQLRAVRISSLAAFLLACAGLYAFLASLG